MQPWDNFNVQCYWSPNVYLNIWFRLVLHSAAVHQSMMLSTPNVWTAYDTRDQTPGYICQGFLTAQRYASTGLCDVSVCPSVWTSVTCQYCAWQSESRIVKCTPSDSPIIVVSGKVWVVEKFARGHPKGTCQMRGGWFFGDFRPIRHHISKTVHFTHKVTIGC